jgi:hypothetical protein
MNDKEPPIIEALAQGKGGRKRWMWLTDQIHHYRFTRGAEIGLKKGNNLVNLLKRTPALKMIGVDPFRILDDGDPEYEHLDFNAIYARYQSRTRKFEGKRLTTHRMTSMEAAERVPMSSLDFVFLDGDHTYAGVKADIETWYWRVRQGGLICGRDIHFETVHRAVAETLPSFKFARIDHCWFVERLSHPMAYNNVIVPSLGVAFFLNAKAGCTSVKRMIMRQLGMGRPKAEDPRSGLRYLTADAIEDADPPWFKVAVVRHPCARLVSAYYDKLKKGRPQFIALGLDRGMSFRKFIRAVAEIPDEILDPHLAPMSRTCGEPDVVVHLETAAEDWAKVQEKIPQMPDLPHLNRSSRPPWKQVARSVDRQIIRERFSEDFGRFGYE